MGDICGELGIYPTFGRGWVTVTITFITFAPNLVVLLRILPRKTFLLCQTKQKKCAKIYMSDVSYKT